MTKAEADATIAGIRKITKEVCKSKKSARAMLRELGLLKKRKK
jgi:hypothetical protein